MYLKKQEDIIEKIINIVIVLLFGVAILNIFIFKDNLIAIYNYKFIIVFSITYIGILFSIMHFLRKYDSIDKNSKKVLIMYIFLISIQITYAALIFRKIGWDAGMVYSSACDLVNGTFNNVEYFSMYGNNVLLLLFLEILFRACKLFGCNNYLFISIIFNIFMIDLAIYYIYKTCEKLIGKKYGTLSYFISIPMLGLNPYLTVVYSDTLSYIFPVIIFYNYILYKNEKDSKSKSMFIFNIAFFSILGYLVKPTNIIISIAIFIIELLSMIVKKIVKKQSAKQNQILLNKNKYKQHFINCFIVFFTILVVYGSFDIYKNLRLKNYISKEITYQNSFPMTHFMMMGLKPEGYEGKYYGVYLEDDVNSTKSQIGKSAKKEYNIKQIKIRLKAMGIKGYISYLYDKYTFIISDGSFFYGDEGNFYQSEPYFSGKLASLVQGFSYVDGKYYNKITVNIMQSYWIIILGLILISSILSLIYGDEKKISILKLSIIGIIAFILLFEARSRYLMNYLPVFILLAIYSINKFEKIYAVKYNKKNVELLGGEK